MDALIRLIRRALGRLRRLALRMVPLNISHRPTAVLESLREFAAAGGRVHMVFPEQGSRFSVPLALLPGCPSQVLPLPEASLPAARVAEVPGGRILTDGTGYVAVVTRDKKLLGEVSLQLGEPGPEQNPVFARRYFPAPLQIPDEAFPLLIGGSGEGNYFHWLFDVLPRLHLLKESGLYSPTVKLIVPSSKRNFQRETLRLLGFGPERLIDGHRHTHIRAGMLLASTYVRPAEHIPYWACSFLRDSFLHLADGSQDRQLLYISRRDAGGRRTANESELQPLLLERGIRTVSLEGMPFAQQVRLFASAKAVIAPHGAALANLAFCRPGTGVLELFADGYTPTMYAELSHRLGLGYNFLLCPTVRKDKSLRSTMCADMCPEPREFATALDRMLLGKPGLAGVDNTWVFLEHSSIAAREIHMTQQART